MGVKGLRVRFSLFLLASILLTIISLRAVAYMEQRNKTDRTLMYVQFLNYSLPLIMITSFNTEDVAEENKSLEERVWNRIGIDINSKVSFLGKEIALFNISLPKDYQQISQVESILPYKLNDASIQKETLQINTGVIESTIVNKNKPLVLIYHSHTTEGYSGTKNSSDETKNVCAVGDSLEYELEKNYGIETIHDKTFHDALGDITAYSKSRDTVEKYLKQYKDFKLIIDIHRDSSSNKKNDITKLNGETVAKCMFVMNREGPYADKNLAIATKMLTISNKLFPHFLKDIYFYNRGALYFNQDLSSNSILIEVGTNLNLVSEAKASSKYLARIIAEYLKG